MNIKSLKDNFNSLIFKLEKTDKNKQLNYLIELDNLIEEIKYKLSDNTIDDKKDREYYKVNKNIYNKILPLSMLYYISNIDYIENIKK
jgi:hypothetical protein